MKDTAGTRKILCPGAARGIRTPDPIITNDVLYQLSYCGFTKDAKSLVENCLSVQAHCVRISATPIEGSG
jgi:hypothetical protein